jgi:hypothetical protein
MLFLVRRGNFMLGQFISGYVSIVQVMSRKIRLYPFGSGNIRLYQVRSCFIRLGILGLFSTG